MEGSGQVVASGEELHEFSDRDRVAWCIVWGSYAEYISVPAALVVKLPDDMTYELAAASIFQGSTAHYLVEDVARLTQGSTCLIDAASGNIGQLLVQMDKLRGQRYSSLQAR
jgi:NADPH2:quinone reductase